MAAGANLRLIVGIRRCIGAEVLPWTDIARSNTPDRPRISVRSHQDPSVGG